MFAFFARFAMMMSLIKLVKRWTKGGKREATHHNEKNF